MTGAVTPQTRFDAAFATRPAGAPPGLMPYFTAGFPTVDALPDLLRAAEDSGCLAAEVGIPFSDPLADGPTIQRAGTHALRNGMTLRLAIEQTAEARARSVTLPLALMTYVNPVLAYGVEHFMRDAHEAGADGLIVPDLPSEEARDVRAAASDAGLALIPLVAPTTTTERRSVICASAAGFVYCVGVTGVTGARDRLDPAALELLDAVRELTPLPRALGFGLRTHEHLERLRGHAEAAIVGSALIAALEESTDEPAGATRRFLRCMLDG